MSYAERHYYNTKKTELIYQRFSKQLRLLDHAISEYAYYWYNQVQPHTYNGYKTPFEKRFGLE